MPNSTINATLHIGKKYRGNNYLFKPCLDNMKAVVLYIVWYGIVTWYITWKLHMHQALTGLQGYISILSIILKLYILGILIKIL